MNFRVLLLAGFVALAGCSSTQVSINYQPGPEVVARSDQALVQVGKFTDARKTDAHRLGAIRGGYGNELNTLKTDAPVIDLVRDSFAQGMTARGLLSTAPGTPPYILTATVTKFDCNQYVRREAHAEITVTLAEATSGRVIATDTFRSDLVEDPKNIFDAGIFSEPADLQALAMKALHNVIDAALDSPQLTQALASAGKVG